jgi:hypothetical protein
MSLLNNINNASMNRIKQKLTECTAVVKYLTRNSLQLKRLRKSILLRIKQDLPQMLPASPCCKPLPCLVFQQLQGSLVLLPPASQLAENPDGSTNAMVPTKSKIVVVPTKLKTEVVQTKPKTAVATTKSKQEDEPGQLKGGEPGKT